MPTRDETKQWVRAVLEHHRLKPTELARKIGRVPSTLNRFLNDPEATHGLSDQVVAEIAAFAKLRPYQMPSAERGRAVPSIEPEAIFFFSGHGGVADLSSGDAMIDNVVRMIIGGQNGIDPWLFRSQALAMSGYLPGDVLMVDLNAKPRPHDVVCAQVYDWNGGRAQTVFRLYEPPYLLASTTDPAMLRPLVVDDDRVIIKGVVTASLRPRRNIGLAA